MRCALVTDEEPLAAGGQVLLRVADTTIIAGNEAHIHLLGKYWRLHDRLGLVAALE